MGVAPPPVRVAVIGAGYMAREHIRAFRDVPDTVVAGIYSRTRDRADALAGEFGVAEVADSIDALYERTRAELVVVTVSETAMGAVAEECCAYPWTLLLEKPPGLTVEEAESISRVADEHGRQVYVALNRRFYGSTLSALSDLATLPGPRFITVLDQQDQDQARSLGFPEPVVAHWMYANSIHTIDYLRLFGRGEVVAVEPIVRWDPARPWIVVAHVRFASGDVGLYEGIWKGPGPWAVTVSTADKRWELRPLERAAFQRAGERRLEEVPAAAWDTDFKPGLRAQAEAAVRVAGGDAGGQSTGLPTLGAAIETMRLIRAIFEG